MPSLVISNIKKLDRKSSETDIPVEAGTQLKNFSLTETPGALVKNGEYADAATALFSSALPASITWKNIGEMSLTSPSNTDIYLLHGQDGSGNNHLYVGKYWDGSAFQNGFRKITEAEGIYTADAGTNGNQIVDSALLSSVDDYYNGWMVVINIAASSLQTAAIVTDYVGSTKTLTLRTAAITGATTGDTYYISRWPLRSGVIPTVDDIIRFAPRENTIVGMAGNQSQWPTQFSLWYGYINKTYGIDPTTITINDFYLDVQPLLKPYVTAAPPAGRGSTLIILAAGGGSVTAGTWTMHYAYVYDGFQIGPLSSGVSATLSGVSFTLSFVLTIPIETCYRSTDGLFYQAYDDSAGAIPTAYSPHLASRRMTGIRIYLQSPTGSNPQFWRDYTLSDFTEDNNEFNLISSTQILFRAALAIDTTPSLGNTYVEDVGQDGSELKPNFKYGVAVDEHFIVGAVRTKTGERKNNYLMASVVDGSGVATPDNFGGSNIINLGFYGAKQVTGLKVIGDTAVTTSPKRRILVATDDDIYILTLVSGSDFGFALDRIGEKEGIVAPDSIVAAEGLIFGVSRNGFRVYNEQNSRIIGEGLKDDFEALTNPAEAVGAYYKKQRTVLWLFPTDQKYYTVNLLDPDLGMAEMSFANVLRILLGSRTGSLYSMSTSSIYLHDSGLTQAGSAIIPVLATKALTARDWWDEQTGANGSTDAWINPQDGYLRYKSAGSAITMTVTKDGGTGTLIFPNLSLPAQTTVQSRRFRFPMGVWAKDLKFTFTLSSAQASTNTDFVWEQLKVTANLERRSD